MEDATLSPSPVADYDTCSPRVFRGLKDIALVSRDITNPQKPKTTPFGRCRFCAPQGSGFMTSLFYLDRHMMGRGSVAVGDG